MGLFLGCERGPLQSATGLWVAFLAAVRAQLAAGLPSKEGCGGGSGGDQPRARGGRRRHGSAGEEGGSGSSSDEDGGGGGCPLGLPLVEALLPDSFLRAQFGSFLEMLHDAGAAVPPQLASQAAQLEALMRGRLGWDFRLKALGRCGGGGGGLDSGEGDDDEDGPVVVELSEEERRLAGLEI